MANNFAYEEAEDTAKHDELLSEIRQLSEKTHSQLPITVTDFQKQCLLVHAGIEKILLELLADGCAIKVMLMSIFYFWYTLAEPMYCKNPKYIGEDTFTHMVNIIRVIKETVKNLPEPKHTAELKVLNEKIETLKQYIYDPNNLEQMPEPEKIQEQTEKANKAIHTASSKYLEQDDMDMEAVANALFCHWLRLSVFFGVTEQEWQKMDYYTKEILDAVARYVSTTH